MNIRQAIFKTFTKYLEHKYTHKLTFIVQNLDGAINQLFQ